MFSFPMLKGDPSTALNDMHSVVLTEQAARSLFGSADAMGKTIRIGNKENFTVTGILKDPPDNTRFYFEYLLPWSYKKYGEGQDLGWNDNSTSTYVMLKPNTNYADATFKIKGLKHNNRNADAASQMAANHQNWVASAARDGEMTSAVSAATAGSASR